MLLYRFQYGQALAGEGPKDAPTIPSTVVSQAGKVLARPTANAVHPAAPVPSHVAGEKQPRERSTSVAGQKRPRGRSVSAAPRGRSERPAKRQKLDNPIPKSNVRNHAAFHRFTQVVLGSIEARQWMESLREHGKPPGGWDEEGIENNTGEGDEGEGKSVSATKGSVHLITFVREMFVYQWCNLLGKLFII